VANLAVVVLVRGVVLSGVVPRVGVLAQVLRAVKVEAKAVRVRTGIKVRKSITGSLLL
jgi:hypothetical protein